MHVATAVAGCCYCVNGKHPLSSVRGEMRTQVGLSVPCHGTTPDPVGVRGGAPDGAPWRGVPQ